MPTYQAPAVYREEVQHKSFSVAPVKIGVVGFIGRAASGPFCDAPEGLKPIYSETEFIERFGAIEQQYPMSVVIRDFFANGGQEALILRIDATADDDEAALGCGLEALRQAQQRFDFLYIASNAKQDVPRSVVKAALAICTQRRAMLWIDPPASWQDVTDIPKTDVEVWQALGIDRNAARNAIMYFPRVFAIAAQNSEGHELRSPYGAIIGMTVRHDDQDKCLVSRVTSEATLHRMPGPGKLLTQQQSDVIQQSGINTLRIFPGRGLVAWGERTLAGRSLSEIEDKYITVRRLTLFIEESIDRGIQRAISEHVDEALRVQLSMKITAFMESLYGAGLLKGKTSEEAYFVRWDDPPAAPDEEALEEIEVMIGFAPIKPKEYIILRLPGRTTLSP